MSAPVPPAPDDQVDDHVDDHVDQPTDAPTDAPTDEKDPAGHSTGPTPDDQSEAGTGDATEPEVEPGAEPRTDVTTDDVATDEDPDEVVTEGAGARTAGDGERAAEGPDRSGESEEPGETSEAASAEEPAAGSPEEPGPEADGRSRLAAALRPRSTRSQLAAGLLCLLLGLGLVTTVRERDAADLSSLRQADLITLLDSTSDRADRLRSEASDLARTRQELREASGGSDAAREVARERLDVLEILAGTAPATGPGITMTLSGPGADADLLLSAVQELRDAGAEAIALDDVRVVATTYVVPAPGGASGGAGTTDATAVSSVVVDGVAVASPFTFTAIGDAATLASAMSFPGGVLPTLSASGGTGEVVQEDAVDITAVRAGVPGALSTPEPPDAGAGAGS